MNDYEYENYLAHYGVKGMKWGVRRAVSFVSNQKRKMPGYYKIDGYDASPKVKFPVKGGPYEQNRRMSKRTDYDMISDFAKGAKTVGKAVSKRVEKSRKKSEARRRSYEKTTDRYGVGGAALRSYSEYNGKKLIKGNMAHLINAAANAYISNNSSNYKISRGVDFVRKAAINGLSISSNIDQLQAYANVAKAYVYAIDKTR